MPKILILRPELGSSPKFLLISIKISIIIFFIINNLGMATFMPTIKNYLNYLISYPKRKITFISSVPFIVGFTIAFLIPSISTIFALMGLIICNFNGYIIPCLLKIYNKSTKHWEIAIYLIIILLFLTLGILGCIGISIN